MHTGLGTTPVVMSTHEVRAVIGGVVKAIAWFLIAGPLLLGLYGLALVLNLFGATTSQVSFYKGREDWFPILSGGLPSTHRLVGVILVTFGVLFMVAFLRMGVLG